MANLNDYKSSGVVDWREQLRRNQRRTIFVIFLFVFIYFTVGTLIDLFLVVTPVESSSTNNVNSSVPSNNASNTSSENNSPYVLYTPSTLTQGSSQTPITIEDAFHKLITFQITPMATLIMLGIAFLSLLITLLFHQQISMLGTDYTEITANTREPRSDKQLYDVVEELKIASGLHFMPKVYIIEADYMNAFASGMSEKSALVAITRGLLNKLDRYELQAVMAHELSHIRHDDIRLTITVAILSNLMLIALDLVFRGILYGDNRNRDNKLLVIIVVLRFVLPILTLLLVLYLSRKRELMADSGSVELIRDNEPLARALLKIDADHKENEEEYSRQYASTPHEEVRQASYLYDPRYAGIDVSKSINDLFSTHPPLEERLAALGYTKKKIKNLE